VKKSADDPQHAFPGHGQMKPEQLEIARLKREVAKLKAERDILKKAAAPLREAGLHSLTEGEPRRMRSTPPLLFRRHPNRRVALRVVVSNRHAGRVFASLKSVQGAAIPRQTSSRDAACSGAVLPALRQRCEYREKMTHAVAGERGR
jgi:anti-sigma factor RsiW